MSTTHSDDPTLPSAVKAEPDLVNKEISFSNEDTILRGKQLAIVFAAMLLSLLLIALDQTILATALPRIASDFGAFSLQGWVATAFILAQTVFLLFYGQVLRIYSAKWTLVSTIIIFEAGSLVCALAKNVDQLIAGRTVSGVGAAGMFVAMIQIVSQVTLLEDRPKLFGLFGAVFGLSSVIGPLIGGGFTDHVTWRWSVIHLFSPRNLLIHLYPGFYINLPIGGLSLFVVTTFLKSSIPLGADPTKRSVRDLLRQTARMDFVGATLVSAAVTSLVLALQWGGNTKPWNDKDVIICFVLAGVIAIAFVAWEKFLGDGAMTPLVIFNSRSIYGIFFYSILTRFSLLLFSYYIPIFYQAAKHRSATTSGIDLLPFMLAVVLSVICSGQLVGKFGYYWPFLVASPVFLALGSGLLYTLGTTTPNARIIGFQILAGMGVGLGMQNVLLAIQAEFRDEPKLIGQATSMTAFAQFLGGTIGLGVAEPVFASELSTYLAKYAPDAPASIVKESPTMIYSALPPDMIPGVVLAYTKSLEFVFLIGVPVAFLGLISALFIKNIKISKIGFPGATKVSEDNDTEKNPN